MCNGGRQPGPAEIFAPIWNSGVTIRSMGRRDSEASPIRSLLKCCPARMPANIRIVEPELPQSSAADAALRAGPRPVISTVPFLCSTVHPNSCMQAKVLAQSAPEEKFSKCVTPSAIPPNSAYRCEIDLSPGKRILPARFLAGRIVMADGSLMSEIRKVEAVLSCLRKMEKSFRQLFPMDNFPVQRPSHSTDGELMRRKSWDCSGFSGLPCLIKS